MEMLTLSFPPHYIEPVCAENPIRVDRGAELPKLAE